MSAGGEMVAFAAMPRERIRRLAFLCAIRSLRESVRRHRTISLPNLLRLFQRRCAAVGLVTDTRGRQKLERWYRAEQPFNDTDWRCWREETFLD